ncbi:MAG: MaoC/PaaZ C-terminal domain-containing protein [bacterium]|nr:MaoC/PaaZ C-terminal domain-containing protein [bacterium]
MSAVPRVLAIIPAASRYSCQKKFIVDEKRAGVFCEIVGDDNPVHDSDSAAREEGFERAIGPGMYVLSLVSGFIQERFPRAIARELVRCVFPKPVYYGEEIAAVLTVVGEEEKRLSRRKKVTLDVAVTSGAKKVMKGTIKVVVRI